MCGERRPHPAFAMLRHGRRGRLADECEIGDVAARDVMKYPVEKERELVRLRGVLRVLLNELAERIRSRVEKV